MQIDDELIEDRGCVLTAQILQSTWDNMIKEFLIKQQVWLMDAFIDFAFAAHSTTRNLNRKYIIVLSIKNR